MEIVFRRFLTEDFVAAAVFDIANLSFILERLVSSSPWPEPMTTTLETIIHDSFSFLQELTSDAPASGQNLSPYTTTTRYTSLLAWLLLFSPSHRAFVTVTSDLKTAAIRLSSLVSSPRTPEFVTQLKAAKGYS